MNVSILIATFGDEAWSELAWSRAYPSAAGQSSDIVVYHGSSLAQARNHAAEVATGDWLCFLDADDELCEGYTEAMGRAHERTPNLSPRLYAPAVSYDGSRPRIPNLGGWPSVNECVIGTLVPKWLFVEVGGFRDLDSLEDYDLWLRCAKAGARIVHVPDAVYCAHVTAGSRNSDQSVYARLREEHAEVWPR